jgi:8-amino-7-oxononanoate synthase
MTSVVADPLAWLRERAASRRAAGLRRRVRPRHCDDGVLDLASNDYLGLARDRRVVAAGVAALEEWGAGATGSRLVTGSTDLHAELESALASFAAADAALVFSSGYSANLGAITALSGAGTLVVSDAHNHASIVDACRLSRARVVVTSHNDVTAVETALADRHEERALVVTDAVFSVDGDAAPVGELHRVCRAHGALLVVDEAHSFGVSGAGGAGVVVDAALATEPDVVRTVTLSKALGSQGGAVLAHREVIDHLVDAARTFIFDTALAPPSAGAALAALQIVGGDPQLPARALRNAGVLAGALGVAPSAVALATVRVGAAEAAHAAATACLERGVRVGCFRPPSVPDGVSRLRLTARADLEPADLHHAAEVVQAALRP